MGEDEIKVGLMTKRAQQKKSFGPVNYKERIFVLTNSKLSYYEGSLSNRGKIKGSINIPSISFIGPLSDGALNRTSAFQIIHDGYILYCCAKGEADRDSWISNIKQVCHRHQSSGSMQTCYHPNIFSNGKWQCCGHSKNNSGCVNVVDEYKKPLPDVPRTDPQLSGSSIHTLPHHQNFDSNVDPRSFTLGRSDQHETAASWQNPPLPSKPVVKELSNSFARFQASDDSSSGRLNSRNPTNSSYPQSQQHHTLNRNVASSHVECHNQNSENFSHDCSNNFEEESVRSYPHYFRGLEQDTVQIPSKSYEHTVPVHLNTALPPEESRIDKVVVAMYDYEPAEPDDLQMRVGDRFTVIDDTRPHWWLARNSAGAEGYVPSNFLQEEQSDGVEAMSWFQKDMSRQRAEYLLKEDAKEGSFIIRNSTQPSVVYTLSVISKGGYVSGPFSVKHYHIKQDAQQQYFLSEKHPMPSVMELINYHKHNAGGLVTRLRNAPVCLQNPEQPSTHLFSNSKWEIDYNDLEMRRELGSGQFGCVKLARYRKRTLVAVKVMKENTMEEDSFIEEAEVMTRLTHKNLVGLYGVVTKQRPICIVTEFMEEGCLLDYVRKNYHLLNHPDTLLDICHQVCSAMQYLEAKSLIHRDLAARNCLVGKNMIVKVADFGLTRYVLDDEYTSSLGSKFPIKWAAPEVLSYTKFSSKSDVWAFGVLMWELFSGGKMPFAALSNSDVVDQVARGLRLTRPDACPEDVYQLMKAMWEMEPDQRPPFRQLYETFYSLIDRVAATCLPENMYDA